MIRSLLKMALLEQITWRPVWLLRDEYLTALEAGDVSGSPAEPGPGSRTVVDTENKLSIHGAALAISGGKATPGQGDPAVYYPALNRAGGRAVIMSLKRSTWGVFYAGFAQINSGIVNGHSFRVSNANVTPFDNGSAGGTIFIFPSDGSAAACAVIARSAGALYLTRTASSWIVQWVSSLGTTDPLYPACSSYSQALECVHFRACDLPAPFDSDHGLAVQRLAGARGPGDPFMHVADCLIEFTAAALPTSGSLDTGFRMADPDNLWLVRVTAGGDFQLIERVGGTDTSRGLASGVVADGHRCVVICEGETIRGFSNNTLRWTYTSASSFKTKTSGLVSEIGPGGAVSDLVSWPRKLNGRARALLETAAK